MRKRAVITGIGVVTPLGNGLDVFWPRALRGETAVGPIPGHWNAYFRPNSTIWAPLPSHDFSDYAISRVEAIQLDRCQQISLACARQALETAGIGVALRDEKKNSFAVSGVDAQRVGVFMGTGVGGMTTTCATIAHHVTLPAASALVELRKRAQADESLAGFAGELDGIRTGLRTPQRFNPFTVSMAMPNGTSAIVGIKYGLHGANSTCACACASGTMAIGFALRAVQSGAMPLALAGGVEYLGDDWGGVFRSFDVIQALVRPGDAPASANRPFDVNRSGFLFAEGGGAVLVIEELEHAVRRSAPVIAELVGFAETFDAHSVMIMEPSGAHIERMVRLALEDAAVAAAAIDYVNAHGTGTILNDQTECAMLDRVFGDGPLVNSTKSLIGHTIGASGAIEAAVTALSLRDQTTHICANLEAPISNLRFVRAPASLPMTWALSESFAFGGHNAALVMKAFRGQ